MEEFGSEESHIKDDDAEGTGAREEKRGRKCHGRRKKTMWPVLTLNVKHVHDEGTGEGTEEERELPSLEN